MSSSPSRNDELILCRGLNSLWEYKVFPIINSQSRTSDESFGINLFIPGAAPNIIGLPEITRQL